MILVKSSSAGQRQKSGIRTIESAQYGQDSNRRPNQPNLQQEQKNYAIVRREQLTPIKGSKSEAMPSLDFPTVILEFGLDWRLILAIMIRPDQQQV
ncbi:unnamed protein product [Onchocerca ochengi]|uniref:Uncharacterized protein n=1 Tax=Onchocerca ochengi TaxID=42157 RepID=A0A182EFQ1_ONCOC|nr:unnamed protein product [Onchocerca ochengi]